jgi:magnesium-transporting ATPase (P-type)
MNIENYNNLKFKYKLFFAVIVFVAMGISAYPIWELSIELAEYLEIDLEAPIKEQVFGWHWFFGFILIGAVNLVGACILLTFAITKLKGWSFQQALDYFWRYENFPTYWYKK